LKPKHLISVVPHVVKLLLSLGILWLTLDFKFRKAKKTFEKELIRNGVPKEVAKRLSKKYEEMKNQLKRTVLSSMRGFP